MIQLDLILSVIWIQWTHRRKVCVWINPKAKSSCVCPWSQPGPCSPQIPVYVSMFSKTLCMQPASNYQTVLMHFCTLKKIKYQAHFRKHNCQRCIYDPKVQESPICTSSPQQTCHTNFQHPPYVIPFTYCYTDWVYLAQHKSLLHSSIGVLSSWVLPWLPWTFCELPAPGFMGTIKISTKILGFMVAEKTHT